MTIIKNYIVMIILFYMKEETKKIVQRGRTYFALLNLENMRGIKCRKINCKRGKCAFRYVFGKKH